jgi:hypothetical protein
MNAHMCVYAHLTVRLSCAPFLSYSYVLYTVTILRKFTDSFRAACREKR